MIFVGLTSIISPIYLESAYFGSGINLILLCTGSTDRYLLLQYLYFHHPWTGRQIFAPAISALPPSMVVVLV